jgi:Putative zinc- or iron-chelating domain
MEEDRRQGHEIGPIGQIYISADGQREQLRAAGSPSQLMEEAEKLEARTRAGEKVSTSVPCAGCTQCCHAPWIRVDPSVERQEDLDHLDIVSDPGQGGPMLRKAANGACVHLGPKGCSVYEHRPRACRMYDCRLFAIAGTLDNFTDMGAGFSPPWAFRPRDKQDRIFVAAMRLAGEDYRNCNTRQHFPRDILNWARQNYRLHWEDARAMVDRDDSIASEREREEAAALSEGADKP